MLRAGVFGVDEAISVLASVNESLNPTKILDEATAVLLARIRQRFLAEVDTDGKPWVPSLASKVRKAGRGGGTLFNTGRLFHSIQEYAESLTTRYIGTDVPYGKYHQFGTRTLPRREFLGVSNDDMDVMTKVIVRRVQDAMK